MSNFDKLNAAACVISNDLTILFDHFDIDYDYCGRYYSMACPIHHGDNPNALIMYHNNGLMPIWRCNTRGCQKKFKQTIWGFVQGCISKPRQIARFDHAIEYLLKLYELDLNNLADIDIKRYTQKDIEYHFRHQRDIIRPRLQIPSEYFLNRNFSKTILNKYDVGDCFNYKSKFYKRAIVPIYDVNYNFAIGYIARSLFEKCEICGQYHQYNCPKKHTYCKWRCSEQLETDKILYNYWFANKHMQDSKSAILVEGQSDVWRLEESGIHNAVGTFGTKFTEYQKGLLDKCGVRDIIVMSDNDEAGIEMAINIKKRYGHMYRLFFPKFLGHDVGELNTDVITKDIKPLVNKLCPN